MALTEWVAVAKVGDLADDDMMMVTAGPEEILLALVDGNYYAIDNWCTHAGGMLDQGVLHTDTLEVECPIHEGFAAGQPRTIAVWNPRGALKTEAWRWYVVDKQAPQEVKDAILDYFLKYAGPGGLTEQDDMENWNYASAASRGTIARRHPYNYQMGMGFESTDRSGPWAPEDALFSEGISEQNQRGFYRRWSDLMHAESWRDVPQALLKR